MGMPGMMGVAPLQMSLKLQMATLQALATMNSKAPALNLLKNLPLVGQKRPIAKPAPSLNLLANLQRQKKDWDKQKQDKSISDEGSEKKQDLAS